LVGEVPWPRRLERGGEGIERVEGFGVVGGSGEEVFWWRGGSTSFDILT
jgi:hypothetical protein